MKFVHDKYPVHHARVILEWFSQHGEEIEVLPWPGSFGDMMPLEMVWDDVVSQIGRRSTAITSHDQLWEEINAVWGFIFEDEYVKSLVAYIPQQLKAIVRNDGDWV